MLIVTASVMVFYNKIETEKNINVLGGRGVVILNESKSIA